MKRNLRTILTVFRSRDYIVRSRPFELNIVGIRSDATEANRFDDWLVVFFRDDNRRWQYFEFPATTDPGTYYLHNPIAVINSQGLKGTAILEQGQYDAYEIAKHRGKYDALCQRRGNVVVIRDYNRDSILDFNNGVRFTGRYGINIHAPSGNDDSVDRDSAGCTVLARKADFKEVMRMAYHHRDLWGNEFLYTVIDLRAMRRAKWRRRAIAAAGMAGTAAAVGLGYLLWEEYSQPTT